MVNYSGCVILLFTAATTGQSKTPATVPVAKKKKVIFLQFCYHYYLLLSFCFHRNPSLQGRLHSVVLPWRRRWTHEWQIIHLRRRQGQEGRGEREPILTSSSPKVNVSSALKPFMGYRLFACYFFWGTVCNYIGLVSGLKMAVHS